MDPSSMPHDSCSAPSKELETPRGEALDPGHIPVDLTGTPVSRPLSHLYTTEAPPPATMVQILPLGFSKVSFRLAPLLASRSAM